ncbi:hypothetical protein [Candidatus Darwinibacter acetoxidans]
MRVVLDSELAEASEFPPLLTGNQLAESSGGALKIGDPRLEAVANAASEAVRRYCRWHVTPVVEETVVLDGTGGKVLQLPSMRVWDVSEVKIGGTVVPPDQYAWSAAGLLELHGGLGGWREFPRVFRVVEVTFTHGYHQAPDLVAVAAQIGRFALASPMGRTREQAGQIAVTWGASQGLAWTEGNLAIMAPYRLQVMP